jgi:sulfur carrier protein ThiS
MGEQHTIMPKLTIKLMGTLPRDIINYDPSKGIRISVTAGTTVRDVIRILNLEAKRVCIASLDGILVGFEKVIEDDSELKLFQPIAGG